MFKHPFQRKQFESGYRKCGHRYQNFVGFTAWRGVTALCGQRSSPGCPEELTDQKYRPETERKKVGAVITGIRDGIMQTRKAKSGQKWRIVTSSGTLALRL